LVLLIGLLLSWPAKNVDAQNDWSRYKPGTLAELARQNDSVIRVSIREVGLDDKPSNHFTGHQSPTVATVIYKGESRPINRHRREIIHDWGLSFMRDSSIADDFHREYLFQEGIELVWLPVQDRVATYFPKELRAGQPVTLFVMLLGGHYEAGRITWAFIVNEFKAGSVSPKA
jgi:hypothetical protein